MAAANPVMLSSSPPDGIPDCTPRPKPCAMSSSPVLPSPSVFFGQKSPKTIQLTSGSGKNPIPNNVSTGFASAATILRQSQSRDFSHFAASSTVEVPQKPAKKQDEGVEAAAKGRKAKTAKENDAMVAKQHEAPAKKPSAKKKSIADIASTVEEGSYAVTVVKKASSRKVKEPAQTKIKKGKVTKAAGARPEIEHEATKKLKSLGSATLQKTSGPQKEVKADHNLEQDLQSAEKQATFGDVSLPLGLEEATKRRKEWTPVKTDLQGFINLDTPETTPALPADSQASTTVTIQENRLGTLLGAYGFAQVNNEATAKPSITRTVSGEALTKRRKLELVTTTFGPNFEIAKPKRSKSPKKKYQTVTAKATEQFVPIEDLPNNSLHVYFEAKSGGDSEEKDRGKETSEAAKRARNPSATDGKVSKVKVKPSKTTKKARLLPPEALIEKAKDQDLLFGTSSQLARDESPTFLREIQQAIKESELADESPIEDSQNSIAQSIGSGSSAGSSLALYTASRGLWSVAARDLKGALQEVEVVDLATTPKSHGPAKVSEIAHEPARSTSEGPKHSLSLNEARKPDQEWTNIDDAPDPTVTERANAAGIPLTSREATADAEPFIPRSLAEASLRERPKSRSPVKKTKAPKEPKEPRAPKTKKTKPAKASEQQKEQEETLETDRPEGMPNYRGFTTSELKEAIKDFGFKAIKKREDQVGLLERCWKDRQGRIAVQPLPANLSLAKPTLGDDIAPKLPGSVDPVKNPTAPKLALTCNVEPELLNSDSPVKKPAPTVASAPNMPQSSSPAKKPRGRPPKAKASAASYEAGDLPDGEKPAPKPKRRAPKAKATAASEEIPGPVDKETKSPRPKGRPPKAKASIKPDENGGFVDIDKSSPLKKPRSKKELLATSSLESTPKASTPAKRAASPNTTPKANLIQPTTPAFAFDPDTTFPPLDRSTLLTKITEAITTYPPAHNMKDLTWHEKILLYEPIVLEDLASWLNTEGLKRVGVDEEISSGMVKEWCESKSVCCLWRENLRGGVRGRW